MNLAIRRMLSILSLCGFALSSIAYIQSFAIAATDIYPEWSIPLGIGALALGIPIQVIEYPRLKGRNFFWTGSEIGIPKWVKPCALLSWLLPVAHFTWFYSQNDAGTATIIDGQYVLEKHHGRDVRVISQIEYFRFREIDLRLFTTLMMSCYFMIMLYWWFPRANPTLDSGPLDVS